MLLPSAALEGYEPIEISKEIEEANEVFRPSKRKSSTRRLSRHYLPEIGLTKNEDRRLTQFVRRVARSTSTKLVLTTREYILRQATQLYEEFEREGVQARRYLLELTKYTATDRA